MSTLAVTVFIGTQTQGIGKKSIGIQCNIIKPSRELQAEYTDSESSSDEEEPYEDYEHNSPSLSETSSESIEVDK